MLFMNSPTGEAINTGLTFLQTIAPFYLLLAFKLTSDGLMRGCGMMGRFMATTLSDLFPRCGCKPWPAMSGRSDTSTRLFCDCRKSHHPASVVRFFAVPLCKQLRFSLFCAKRSKCSSNRQPPPHEKSSVPAKPDGAVTSEYISKGATSCHSVFSIQKGVRPIWLCVTAFRRFCQNMRF